MLDISQGQNGVSVDRFPGENTDAFLFLKI